MRIQRRNVMLGLKIRRWRLEEVKLLAQSCTTNMQHGQDLLNLGLCKLQEEGFHSPKAPQELVCKALGCNWACGLLQPCPAPCCPVSPLLGVFPRFLLPQMSCFSAKSGNVVISPTFYQPGSFALEETGSDFYWTAHISCHAAELTPVICRHHPFPLRQHSSFSYPPPIHAQV